MTSEGPGSSGTRIIANRYPITEGLIAGTTRQTQERLLKPQVKSLVRASDKTLID